LDALYWRGEVQATPLEGKIQAGDCCGSRKAEEKEMKFPMRADSEA
jgi:hypothetical protein